MVNGDWERRLADAWSSIAQAHETGRWYGEYPSLYLSTTGLIAQVRAHLHG